MKHHIFAAVISTLCAGSTSAQSVVILPNNDYDCQYILDNMEQNADLRVFMANYAYGFVSGLNAQRSMLKQPVLDFSRIDNPMLITWSYQMCSANPSETYPTALARMFQILVKQQQSQ